MSKNKPEVPFSDVKKNSTIGEIDITIKITEHIYAFLFLIFLLVKLEKIT